MFNEELRHIHFVYCLDKQADGSYVLLNRNYKPLGFMTDDWIEYSDHPIGVKIKGLGPKTAAKISYKGDENLDRIYLYNDGCIPTRDAANMKAYLKRLDILMSLKVDK
ncbi:hypothetical protein SAMN05878282_103430 [Aquipseudomonas alcaligenes]|uniref:Uncharacterized protein n=2 Tax=Aquipseudomonas alcaligenes TaxID=43263 RepID=A0A1N6S9V9_AQUAC|nr:hypothetical protein SAMN05878282_103430 [Pseudomonas alcaligenes]